MLVMDFAIARSAAPTPSRWKLVYLGTPPMGAIVFAIAAAALAERLRADPSGSTIGLMCGVAAAGALLLCGSLTLRFAEARTLAFDRIADLERRHGDLAVRYEETESALLLARGALGATRGQVMIVDRDFTIVQRYAKHLEPVLGKRPLDENLLEILRRMLPERAFVAAHDYLVLLFDPRTNEESLALLNPLDDLEVPAGPKGGRRLTFDFRRIPGNAEVTHVLVTIQESGGQATQRALAGAPAPSKSELFGQFSDMMRLDPKAFEALVQTVELDLAAIDAVIGGDMHDEIADGTALLRERLARVLPHVRAISMHAALMGLADLERCALAAVQTLRDVDARPALGGEDFLAAIMSLEAMRRELETLAIVRGKLATLQQLALPRETGDRVVSTVNAVANETAAAHGKKIRLKADGFDSRSLPPERRSALEDVLVQLTRNSIAHGIETPEEREHSGKPRAGTIAIAAVSDPGEETFSFRFSDDGRGLDPAAIRRRAVELGLLAAAHAAATNDEEIASMVFVDGFSMINDAPGCGLGALKRRVVDECGGEIALNAVVGRSFEIAVRMPLAEAAIPA
jgi:hypothetical protein